MDKLTQAASTLADKAYDTETRMRLKLGEKGCQAIIPYKDNRINPGKYDKNIYKSRHLIENFFAKLKQYRAIATRYDKTAQNFLGAIYLAATLVWLT
jgi:transposase